MNGLSWFLKARTIWAMPRGHRPQGLGRDHGHPLEAPGIGVSARLKKKICRGSNLNHSLLTHPLQVFFQQLCWKISSKVRRECPWPCSTPWGLWPLSMAQMVLAYGNQLKPFIIITLCRFCFNHFPEKSIPKPPGCVHEHALLLEVYGLWAWPRWSWSPETNLNHSLLSPSTGFVSTTFL